MNPKSWLLVVGVQGQWVVSVNANMPTTVAVSFVVVFFAFASNATYALMGSMLRPWLNNHSRVVWFNRTMAFLLVVSMVLALR